MMSQQPNGIQVGQVKAAFTEEIQAAKGKVTDAFEDDARLFIRSVLPATCEVAQKDALQAGVALRYVGLDIVVNPYVFRQVCTNGAIIAQAVEGQQVIQIGHPGALTWPEIETAIRAAVRACCQPEVFAAATDQIRLGMTSSRNEAFGSVGLMDPYLSRLPREVATQLVEVVFSQWMPRTDRSRFALMNAITALARDTADPEARWELEELGGRIGVPTLTRPPSPQSVRLSGPTVEEKTDEWIRVS